MGYGTVLLAFALLANPAYARGNLPLPGKATPSEASNIVNFCRDKASKHLVAEIRHYEAVTVSGGHICKPGEHPTTVASKWPCGTLWSKKGELPLVSCLP